MKKPYLNRTVISPHVYVSRARVPAQCVIGPGARCSTQRVSQGISAVPA